MQAFIVMAVGAALEGAGLVALHWSATIERCKQRLFAKLKREEFPADAGLDLFTQTQSVSEVE